MSRRLSVALLLSVLSPSLADAATVAAGGSHTVVVTPDHTVWTWGGNGNGQLGDNTTTPKTVPTQLATLSDIVAVAAGASHTLALKSDGTVYAWGLNSNGQLGDHTTTQRLTPVAANVTGIVAIAAGEFHSVALASDGRVWVWGRNSSGQVGKGSTSTSEVTPYVVTSVTGFTAIGAGASHTLAVTSDGTV